MRRTLVIDALGPGGAQRVLTSMANHWAARGEVVTLITLDGDAPPAFALHASVTLIRLATIRNASGALQRLWRRTRHIPALRKAIAKTRPETVISFIDRVNVLVLLATRGLSVPVVVAERTEPSAYAVGWIWERLRSRTYPSAAALVAQSAAALRYFLPVPGRIDRVIPNPVLRAGTRAAGPKLAGSHRRVLGMGRLGPEKGFDRLLAAFAVVAPRFPEWELEIRGEGPERAALERQRTELGLDTRARLPGVAQDAAQSMSSADLFVLSSRFEGFPNVLGEAMAAGLPVISYDCPSGPREIVRHEIDGLLVPPEGGVPGLSAALARLMGDASERARLAARAPEVVLRFDLERVMGLWDELLADVAGGARSEVRR
jgi:GalNAc-alpha-(1->4)-GalNAc-alpha-(1->3)-diNAcBac-PP-undecaprenol alpha-1,4-N-acetyl-D-galactosaminyltransferase